MKNAKNKKEEIFDHLTVDDARRVKERLERNRLTQKWLSFRLDRDFGIVMSKSHISEIIDGKRAMTHKNRRVVWCCHKVLDEYERFYSGR